jgi:RNA polymerase primary sigma factor
MNCIRVKNPSAANSLQVYLKEIREESLLTAVEECELADAIASGDKDARTRMIQANLRLVVKIARDYVGRGMALDDLIGEGNLGLIRATEEFEPRFGTRFSTYASYWIKQSIRHALINTSTTIRLPAHMIGLLTKWRRVERALCRQLGRAASFNEVAESLGLSDSQKMLVAKAHQARQLKLENNLAAPTRRGASSWGSVSHYTQTEEIVEADDEWRILLGRLSCLEPRERTVLILRYGLEGESALTLKEIGRRLGVTREWVRKIEIRAVRKLHNEYAAESSGQPARGSSPRSGRRFGLMKNEETITSGSSSATTRMRPRSRARSHSPLRSIRNGQSLAPAVSSAL